MPSHCIPLLYDIFLLCSPLNFWSSVIFISLSTSFNEAANKSFQKLCFLMLLLVLSVVNTQWTWCYWHVLLEIFIPCLWSQEQLDICWGLAQQTCLPALTPCLGTEVLCSFWLENPRRSRDLFPISCGPLQRKVLSRLGMARSMFLLWSFPAEIGSRKEVKPSKEVNLACLLNGSARFAERWLSWDMLFFPICCSFKASSSVKPTNDKKRKEKKEKKPSYQSVRQILFSWIHSQSAILCHCYIWGIIMLFPNVHFTWF